MESNSWTPKCSLLNFEYKLFGIFFIPENKKSTVCLKEANIEMKLEKNPKRFGKKDREKKRKKKKRR